VRSLLRLPILVLLIVGALIAIGFVARVTGLWPASDPTHARPHQRVP
jgi:hypothetical protein